MMHQTVALITGLSIWGTVYAEVASEITTISSGYNLFAKLPCVGCPFLYQDTSDGTDQPWKSRDDENALLLNISLPYTSAHISINTSPLLTSSTVLPQIFAPQVLLDVSASDISTLIESNQLDNLGGASFGLSYAYSLLRIEDSNALLFHFDVFEVWTDVSKPDLTVKLDDAKQKVLEVVLLRRPLMSAGDVSPAYEIVRADLVPRPASRSKAKIHTMHFHDWDNHGEKGTPSHLVSTASDSFVEYISSGVWSLFIFIMAIIGLFVVICLFCIFGCGLGNDEYESAQHGKRRSNARGSRSDVERGKGRFLSAEELGLRSGGRVVGVGKSD